MKIATADTKLLLFLLLMISILSFPWEALRAEDSVDRPMPADLERELKELILDGTANTKDFKRLLRLAGLYLDVGYGVYVDREKKLAAFQEGARIAQKALALRESSADAHFLYAANLGSAAELEGLMAAAFTIQELKDHVHRVLELDAQHVPAHHMLGRLYEELPWFLGGNQEAAGKHLKQAVSLDFRYAPARLDLARWYLKRGQQSEAVRELTRVIEMPPLTKQWMWERIHRPEAQALLQQIVGQENSEPPRVNP
jgi:tetratricopeptide (TPR) repeat protein